MIDFQCAQCGKRHNSSERYAGKTVKCPCCGGATRVPALASKSFSPPLLADFLDEELTSDPPVAVSAPAQAPVPIPAPPEKERIDANEKTRKSLEGLSYLPLGFAALVIAPAMAPGWWIHSDFLAENGYLLAVVCGIIAGLFQGHVYGPRYYFIYIVGMSFAAILSVAIMSSFLNHVRVVNCPKFTLLLIMFLGMSPGFIVARFLKKVQNFIYPPSEEELARYRQIDQARKAEKKEYYSYSVEEFSYRSKLVFICLLAIIPPIGFLLAIMAYAGNPSGSRGRRAGILGMILSIAIFITYVCIYFYVTSLDSNLPNARGPVVPNFNMPAPEPPVADNDQPELPLVPPEMQKEPEDIPPRNAKPSEPRLPAASKPENPPQIPADIHRLREATEPAKPSDDLATLVRQLQGGDAFERAKAVDKLLTVDVKKAPKDVVKSVAQGMKKIAFDKQTVIWDRRKAIEGMAKWGGAYSVPLIIELLQSNRNRPVHEACCQALCILKDPRAVEPVAQLYLTDFFADSAGKCLDAYGADAETAVLKYFPPEEPLMLLRGIDFLKKYGTKKSIPLLLTLRRSPRFSEFSNQVSEAILLIQQREKNRQNRN